MSTYDTLDPAALAAADRFLPFDDDPCGCAECRERLARAIQEYAAAAVEREREACAAEATCAGLEASPLAAAIARAIRARGAPPAALPAARDLRAAVDWAEAHHPPPRCEHGKALRDASGERLEPDCGCRATTLPASPAEDKTARIYPCADGGKRETGRRKRETCDASDSQAGGCDCFEEPAPKEEPKP